jgi:predicted O-methyltransferase YrrM
MALIYSCDKQAIVIAIEKLKEDGLVSSDAFFNYDAPKNLRREVAYRDFDFLTRLSRVAEVETAQSVLALLMQTGIIHEGATYNDKVFDAFRKEVKDKFIIPGTSITPVMERLLYVLSAAKKPRRVIGLGTYCGYALVWAIGASCGQEKAYTADKVYGIDIDKEVTENARENFSKLAQTDHIELIAGDGLVVVENLEGPFDYVYLDVESRELGKGIYLDLLTRLYEKVEVGGWVLAHDTTVPPFASQLEEYLSFVRDNKNFRESISFDVDPFGLELSIK